MALYYAYLFEARGIQRFLFATGKLKDMLGGSELIDFICAEGGYLDRTLEALQLAPTRVRNAGGVFYLFFTEQADAQRLQNVWRLATEHWLPGVEKVDALVADASVQEAIKQGLDQLKIERNRIRAESPAPGPLAMRAPRTGHVAVNQGDSWGRVAVDPKDRQDGEYMDAATQAQRAFAWLREHGEPKGTLTLAGRFLEDEQVNWPNTFDDDDKADRERLFPLRPGSRMVGLVHADGNGLGELLRKLVNSCKNASDKDYADIYQLFSDSLTKATQAAAREVTQNLLREHAEKNTMPARPLVLGGDDLAIIVRDDLALPFTKAYLEAFGRHTQQAMSELKAKLEDCGLDSSTLPDQLSACAGIAYTKCNQPFDSAHELAEGLCDRAKAVSRRHRERIRQNNPGYSYMQPTLAFHKLQDSMATGIDAIHERAHSIQHGQTLYRLSLPAYALSTDTDMPSLADLEALAASLLAGRINDRPLRNLATIIYDSWDEAAKLYQRWRQISRRRDREQGKAPGRGQLAGFDAALERLIGVVPDSDALPFARLQEDEAHILSSPLTDLLTLLGVHAPQIQEQGARQ